jgi:hypothetical protein
MHTNVWCLILRHMLTGHQHEEMPAVQERHAQMCNRQQVPDRVRGVLQSVVNLNLADMPEGRCTTAHTTLHILSHLVRYVCPFICLLQHCHVAPHNTV